MSEDYSDEQDDDLEDDEGIQPGDRVVIQVVDGTHSAEVSGTVLMVRQDSYLDTENVNLIEGLLGYGTVYETFVEIAGLPGLIDVTDLEFEILQENEPDTNS